MKELSLSERAAELAGEMEWGPEITSDHMPYRQKVSRTGGIINKQLQCIATILNEIEFSAPDGHPEPLSVKAIASITLADQSMGVVTTTRSASTTRMAIEKALQAAEEEYAERKRKASPWK